MSMRRFLGGAGVPGDSVEARVDSNDTETVRRIARQLEALPIEKARFLASFAYILTRAAAADLDISTAESEAIEKLVAEHGGLTEAQATLVSQIARHQSLLYGGTEDYLVTRQFKDLSTEVDRIALLRCCYLVGAADDTITSQESDTLQEIASELDIDRPAINAIRTEFAPKLAAYQAMLKLREG
ncbi:MAG TPA: TerB family tellurite resistance protein [Candidatus Limnocylindrales bacterium]